MTLYRSRRAVTIENPHLRLTVLLEGGHIAEIFSKSAQVNPLWTPPWPSIEPSAYHPSKHPEYGVGPEAKLLAGIMGHNLCLDLFGGPSPEEAAAGLTVHGEASIAAWQVDASAHALQMRADLPQAQLRVSRTIELDGSNVRIRESVENLSMCDRPIAWTQHVTLGPPFLEPGRTQFRATATRSKVFEQDFGIDGYLQPAAEFDWPLAPTKNGAPADLRVYSSSKASSAFTTHLMDSSLQQSFFSAFSPTHQLAFGYIWRPADFPWLGIWEENRSRAIPPWNGETITRGLEFGVSPMPESRRQMIGRARLFDTPAYRWIPARARLDVEYWAFVRNAAAPLESAEWPG